MKSGNGVAERLIFRCGLEKSPALRRGSACQPAVSYVPGEPPAPACVSRKASTRRTASTSCHSFIPMSGSATRRFESPRPSHLRWCISYGGAAVRLGEPAS